MSVARALAVIIVHHVTAAKSHSAKMAIAPTTNTSKQQNSITSAKSKRGSRSARAKSPATRSPERLARHRVHQQEPHGYGRCTEHPDRHALAHHAFPRDRGLCQDGRIS